MKKSSKKSTELRKKSTRKDARPRGKAPIWTEGLRDEFQVVYFGVMEYLWIKVKFAKETLDVPKPDGLIAVIRALCCLLREYPYWPRHVKFGRSQIAEWRSLIENNLAKSKHVIPEKYRDEYVSEVMADLDFLDEFIERKPDFDVDI